jgi:hypothetical protein
MDLCRLKQKNQRKQKEKAWNNKGGTWNGKKRNRKSMEYTKEQEWSQCPD